MKPVAMLNEYWGIYEARGELVILPSRPIYCPICASPLILHDFRCYRHPGINHSHCDAHLKCPKCGHWLTFGLPVPEELLTRLQSSRYHGRTLRWELKEIYGEELPREVEERLRRWGYW